MNYIYYNIYNFIYNNNYNKSLHDQTFSPSCRMLLCHSVRKERSVTSWVMNRNFVGHEVTSR